MMGGKPDATFYTQKQKHSMLGPSEKKKNYNVRTSLSKISMEVVSREEDLNKEAPDTDPFDQFDNDAQELRVVQTLINDDASSKASEQINSDLHK